MKNEPCKKLICRRCLDDFRVNPKTMVCEFCQEKEKQLLLRIARRDRLKREYEEAGMTYQSDYDLDEKEKQDEVLEFEREIWEDLDGDDVQDDPDFLLKGE